MNNYILAIETSCDETSMAIIRNGNECVHMTVLTQMDRHADFGGVVPEIASRMHAENITLVLDDVLSKSKLTKDDIDAIAVTYAPGLMGSLLVGLECAKAISMVWNKPLIAVNHIAGHIYANNLVRTMEFPLLALVVSGGHTDLVIMEDDYKFKVLGSTLDDAIGESYDKVARVLGLKYPGGPEVEKLASIGDDTYSLPVAMNDDSYNFSFSGLKSRVVNLVHNEAQKGNEINRENLAKSFQVAAVSQLTKKIEKALKEYDIKYMIIAGGVSANKYLREEVQKVADEHDVLLSVPDFKYCTDNAAMIGCAAYPLFKLGKFTDYSINAISQDDLF